MVKTGAFPSGLDILKGFSDGGGTIRVFFVESPSVETNWAIRIQGDAVSTLQTMYGSGRLIASGSYPGKLAGVLYDPVSNATYFAMADSNAFPSVPFAIAYDERTWEWAPGWPVIIGTSDVNCASYDPLGRPISMSVRTNGGIETASLTLDAVGNYQVVLKVSAGTDEASDTCLVHVVNAPAGTTSNLTWYGGASTPLMDRREWMWSANWKEGTPPADPYPGTLIFRYDGQGVTGRLEQSRTVANLHVGESGFTIGHTIDLGGHVLTVTNRLRVVSSGYTYRQTLNLTNGTLRLGEDNSAASLEVMDPDTFRIMPGATIDTYNVCCVTTRPNAYGYTEIDLRGASVAGGRFRVRRFIAQCWGWYGPRVLLDSGTALQSLEVLEDFKFGIGQVNLYSPCYIGNPADSFVMEGKSLGRLPPNIILKVGTSPSQRGSVTVVEHQDASGILLAAITASGGGSFTAYLTNFVVGGRSGTGARFPRALLDFGKMTNCLVDTHQLLIAPGSDTAGPTDNEQGELRLPPGIMFVGTGVVGAVDGVGFGRLQGSNTTIIVTNALSIRKTGRLLLYVGSTSCGLVISNAADSALDMNLATNGALSITFVESPAQTGLHYGLRWTGDHRTTLGAWLADGRIALNDAALGSRRATLFKTGGETFIGIPPVPGTVFVVK